MPRYLKDPEGCSVSSLRKMRLVRASISVEKHWDPEVLAYQPAALDRIADSMRGVSRHMSFWLDIARIKKCWDKADEKEQ